MDSTEKTNEYARENWVLDHFYAVDPYIDDPQKLAEKMQEVRIFNIGYTDSVAKEEIDREVALINRLYRPGDRVLGQDSLSAVRDRFKDLTGVPLEHIRCWDPQSLPWPTVEFVHECARLMSCILPIWEYCDDVQGREATDLQSRASALLEALAKCNLECAEKSQGVDRAPAEKEELQESQEKASEAPWLQTLEQSKKINLSLGSFLALKSLHSWAKSITQMFFDEKDRQVSIFEKHNLALLKTELAELQKTENCRLFVSAAKHHFETLDYSALTKDEQCDMQKGVNILKKGLEAEGIQYLTFIPKEETATTLHQEISPSATDLKKSTETFLQQEVKTYAEVISLYHRWRDIVQQRTLRIVDEGKNRKLAKPLASSLTPAGRDIEGPDRGAL
jgi:hypothetical protein